MNLFEQYNPKQLAAMTIEDIKKHRKLRNGERIDNALPCPNCEKHLKHMHIDKLINYSGEHKL